MTDHRLGTTTVLALVLAAASAAGAAGARFPDDARFTVVALGTAGGLREGDLSAFLLARTGGPWVALDAGTLVTGIEAAIARGSLAAAHPAALLRRDLAGVLLSHPHLDHVAGLVMASPELDVPTPVYGLATTLEALRDHLFNWRLWPNLADEGKAPAIGLLRYVRLEPGRQADLPGTGLAVTAYPLSHAGSTSTAFLVSDGEAAMLYCGDTGPDAVEREGRLERVWREVAPLVRSRRLRAILLEASYPSERADARLFGHLTPRWIADELACLAGLVDPADPAALAGLTAIVYHVKPAIDGGEEAAGRIQRELEAASVPGVRFILPSQGERLDL